jgi:hypothetical protein
VLQRLVVNRLLEPGSEFHVHAPKLNKRPRRSQNSGRSSDVSGEVRPLPKICARFWNNTRHRQRSRKTRLIDKFIAK